MSLNSQLPCSNNDCLPLTVDSGLHDWEVVYNGSVNVRTNADLSSEIVGRKWKCDKLVGNREGSWLKLHGEPGYIIVELGGYVLLRRKHAPYLLVPNGTCAEADSFPIRDEDTCKAAGKFLGYQNQKIKHVDTLASPEGCYLDSVSWTLRLALGSANVGNGAVPGMKPLCSRHMELEKPVPCEPFVTTTVTTTFTLTTSTVTTFSTTTTSTTTTTTWGWPSMFCFTVIKTTGQEVKLVKVQLEHHSGIFACDEADVFSRGRALDLGQGHSTIKIPESSGHPNIYQEAWLQVKRDGKYKDHDWTVRVDPRTVFLPKRLRDHVSQHTTEDGMKLFITNCKVKSKPHLIGSVEVFSRQAIKSYLNKSESCTPMFMRKGWESSHFMEVCLEVLGSTPVADVGMLADARCNYTGAVSLQPVDSCSDATRVAFHEDFDVPRYTTCFEQALR